jgi:hypothetical protein
LIIGLNLIINVTMDVGCPRMQFFCGFLHAPPCLNDWAVPNYKPTAAIPSNPFYQTLNLLIPSTSYDPSKGSQALMGPAPFLTTFLSLLNGPLEYGGLVGHTVNTNKNNNN